MSAKVPDTIPESVETTCTGDKAISPMGKLRLRSPTKAALAARAHALRRSRGNRNQPMDGHRSAQSRTVTGQLSAVSLQVFARPT